MVTLQIRLKQPNDAIVVDHVHACLQRSILNFPNTYALKYLKTFVMRITITKNIPWIRETRWIVPDFANARRFECSSILEPRYLVEYRNAPSRHDTVGTVAMPQSEMEEQFAARHASDVHDIRRVMHVSDQEA